jgi:hypothetical protein
MTMSGMGVEALAYLGRQTARKTAATGNYHTLPFFSHTILPSEALTDERTLGIGQGRDPESADTDALTVGGDLVAPFYLHSMGLLLTMLLGDPVTTGSGGNFTHVWKSGKFGLPVYTLELQTPRQDHTRRIDQAIDLMANTMQLQFATGGVERATFGMMGADIVKLATTGAGTPGAAPAAGTRLLRKARTISVDGSDVARIVGGSLTYSNNLDPQTYLKNSVQEVDEGLASLTGSLDLRFDTDALMDKATAGTPVGIATAWSIDANKSLTIAANTVRLQRTGLSITGPNGIQQSFQVRGEKTPADGAMLVVTLKNQTASYA